MPANVIKFPYPQRGRITNMADAQAALAAIQEKYPGWKITDDTAEITRKLDEVLGKKI